jgi:hypothetical protein
MEPDEERFEGFTPVPAGEGNPEFPTAGEASFAPEEDFAGDPDGSGAADELRSAAESAPVKAG